MITPELLLEALHDQIYVNSDDMIGHLVWMDDEIDLQRMADHINARLTGSPTPRDVDSIQDALTALEKAQRYLKEFHAKFTKGV